MNPLGQQSKRSTLTSVAVRPAPAQQVTMEMVGKGESGVMAGEVGWWGARRYWCTSPTTSSPLL